MYPFLLLKKKMGKMSSSLAWLLLTLITASVKGVCPIFKFN